MGSIMLANSEGTTLRYRGFILVLYAASAWAQVGPVRIQVIPSAPSLGIGASKPLQACRKYVGALKDPNPFDIVTNQVVWSSANANVATVSPAGVVTAKGVGTVRVMAKSGPFRGVTNLNVLTAVCGDGFRQTGEQCDDGSNTNLDGCSATCTFEQDQRINSLGFQINADAVCTPNRFGSAFTPTAQGQLQAVINQNVASGAISILFAMLGITDLSGANQPSFHIGVLSGTPAAAPMGTTYNGASDLDWWYTPDPAVIDANRVPLDQLSASISSSALTAGPGTLTIPSLIGTPPANVTMSNAVVKATAGAASTPLASSNQGPPGHLASENLDPALTSYAGMSAGSLCGGMDASSLAAIPIPGSLLSGTSKCTENYPAAASFLDVMLGGCKVFAGFIPVINPTQPDTSDPNLPAAGAGAPYTLFQTNLQVTSCHDKNGTTVPLAACLASAAYSSYFKFTSDRVIIK